MRDWIKTEFDQWTKEKANGKLRVLFLDGHSTHKTLEVIDFCRERGIILMAFPPHTTHALQRESCSQAA
jgi:transposase